MSLNRRQVLPLGEDAWSYPEEVDIPQNVLESHGLCLSILTTSPIREGDFQGCRGRLYHRNDGVSAGGQDKVVAESCTSPD